MFIVGDEELMSVSRRLFELQNDLSVSVMKSHLIMNTSAVYVKLTVIGVMSAKMLFNYEFMPLYTTGLEGL